MTWPSGEAGAEEEVGRKDAFKQTSHRAPGPRKESSAENNNKKKGFAEMSPHSSSFVLPVRHSREKSKCK